MKLPLVKHPLQDGFQFVGCITHLKRATYDIAIHAGDKKHVYIRDYDRWQLHPIDVKLPYTEVEDDWRRYAANFMKLERRKSEQSEEV